MNRPSNKRLRTLSYIVIIYMIMAFAWWAYLLLKKNQISFEAQIQLIELLESNEKEKSSASNALTAKHQRQVWMIYGEAIVFIFSLITGLWLINRAYNKEMNTAQQASNFLLAITHELKSPLASIKLVLDTFAKHQLSDDKRQQLSNSGLEETERLNTMVNNLLLSAKLSSVYTPLLENTPITEFFSKIITQIRKRNPNTPIHFDPSGIQTPIIEIDKNGMETVLNNLLDNALKYGQNLPIEIKCYNKSQYFCFDITDQGIGIPKEEYNTIFERFYRIGSEETRKSKGSGLGLYIVKKVTEAHNGKISLTSKINEGSTFTVCLPTQTIS